jgi:hypothetical protein
MAAAAATVRASGAARVRMVVPSFSGLPIPGAGHGCEVGASAALLAAAIAGGRPPQRPRDRVTGAAGQGSAALETRCSPGRVD